MGSCKREVAEMKPGTFDSRSPAPDRLAAVVPLFLGSSNVRYCRTELKCLFCFLA